MKAIVVIQMKDKLTKNSELGGFLEGGIEEIVYGRGSYSPGGMEHKENSDKGGEGIKVPAPCFVAKQVGDKERRSH